MNEQTLTPYASGVRGEISACNALIQRGMEPLCRRFRSPFGEADLVMLDHDTLVFVEVKTRANGTAVDGQYAITPKKRQRLIQTARHFLGEHPEHGSRMIRFDVVVIASDGVHHLINAFEGSEW